jgi:His/Glu/Gln/Arg/opine family amino acid ABC transporter permease subunit
MSDFLEALRAPICGIVGMRCDTWYLFVDPNIVRFFGEGLLTTIELSLVSVILSFAVGLLFALGRLSRRWWIRWPAIFYIEAIRALPVLLLIAYFGIKGTALFRPILSPIFGEDFELSRFWAGVLGLSLYTSAVLAEIIRAGIVSLPRGQFEAAAALGLGYVQQMRHVILPQALRLMVPAMMGQLTTVIKDTSLVATIGVFELVRQGRVIYTQFFNPIEVFLIVAVIYFVICFALSQGSRRLELRAPAEVKVKIEELQLRDQVA